MRSNNDMRSDDEVQVVTVQSRPRDTTPSPRPTCNWLHAGTSMPLPRGRGPVPHLAWWGRACPYPVGNATCLQGQRRLQDNQF